MADRGGAPGTRDIRSLARTRDWTPFEMQAVLALICRGVHLEGTEEFTDRLNQALNPSAERKREKFKDDIEEKHVRSLLHFLHIDKKAAIAFIERQHTGRLTRAASMAFKRSIRYTGTDYEWLVEGRKDFEPNVRAAQYQKCVERMQQEDGVPNNWASEMISYEDSNKNARLGRQLDDGEASPNIRRTLNMHHEASPLPSIEGSVVATTPHRVGTLAFGGGFSGFNPGAAKSPLQGPAYIEDWLQDPSATDTSGTAPGFEGLNRLPQPISPELTTTIGNPFPPETPHSRPSYNTRNKDRGYLGGSEPVPQHHGQPTSSPATSNKQASPTRSTQYDASFLIGEPESHE